MDADLEFVLEEIKDLLERVRVITDKIEDHSDDAARSLDRIADDMVSLKIDADSITKAIRKPNDTGSTVASESGLRWYVFGILMLLLVHVLHHW